MEPPALIRRTLQLKASAIAALLCIAIAAILRGTMLHFVLVLLPGAPLAALVLFAFLIALLCYRLAPSQRTRAARAKTVNYTLATLIVVLGVPASYVLGIFLKQYDIQSAKKWALELVPAIERYRAEHGDYPAEIEAVARIDDGPWRVREGDLHFSHRDGEFTLELPCDDSFIFPLGWTWSSRERIWRYYD